MTSDTVSSRVGKKTGFKISIKKLKCLFTTGSFSESSHPAISEILKSIQAEDKRTFVVLNTVLYTCV